MLVRRAQTVTEISRWFEQLWKRARPITRSDLAAAKASWEAARRALGKGARARQGSPATGGLPPGWKPTRELRELARRVRGEAPHAHGDVASRRKFVRGLQPERLTRMELEQAIGLIAEWTGHIGAFRPALREPISRVRKTFAYAFDENIDVVERLKQLSPAGTFKLDGFGMNAWTLLLYWRNPIDCIPLNAVTLKFLSHFRLGQSVGASVSPSAFRRWRSIARDLQQRLSLPTLAHVDLMAWRLES